MKKLIVSTLCLMFAGPLIAADNYGLAGSGPPADYTIAGTNTVVGVFLGNGATISNIPITGIQIVGTKSAGKILTATASGAGWSNAPSESIQWRDQITTPSMLSKGGTAVSRESLYPTSLLTCEGWKVNTYGDGEVQFNHDLAKTNAPVNGLANLYVVPHVHLSITNVPADTSNTTWVLVYRWANIGDKWTNCVSGALTNTWTITTVNQHYVYDFTPITNNLASGSISSVISYRLQRIAAATGDLGDSAGITRLHDFDIHYPTDRRGSTGPSTY